METLRRSSLAEEMATEEQQEDWKTLRDTLTREAEAIIESCGSPEALAMRCCEFVEELHAGCSASHAWVEKDGVVLKVYSAHGAYYGHGDSTFGAAASCFRRLWGKARITPLLPTPSSEEAALIEQGMTFAALRGYMHRTGATLLEARAALRL
jgi:hypothetical protein